MVPYPDLRWRPTPTPLRRVALVAACVAAAAGLMPPAAAQAQDEMQEARRAFERGDELYESGEFERAAEKFERAYELSERSELLFNIGKAYQKAGRLERAEQFLQRYLEENPEARNRQQVVDDVVEIQQKLAARMGSVEVASPENLEVHVDGESESRCTTPCTVSLEPGEHELAVRSGTEIVDSRSIDVSKSSSKTLEFSAANSGALHVRTRSGEGAVFLDGTERGTLPMSEPLTVAAGTHELRIRSGSGDEWAGEIAVEPGETTRLLVAAGTDTGDGPEGGGRTRRTVAYVMAGASVALIGGGLLLGRAASDTHDVLSRQRRRGAVDPELIDKGRTEQTGANVLLGAGAAALLVGGSLFTWELLESSD